MGRSVVAGLVGARNYYRQQAAVVQTRLDASKRYRGRIKDVREHALWVRLADEIDAYLAVTPDDEERERAEAGPDDIPLLG